MELSQQFCLRLKFFVVASSRNLLIENKFICVKIDGKNKGSVQKGCQQRRTESSYTADSLELWAVSGAGCMTAVIWSHAISCAMEGWKTANVSSELTLSCASCNDFVIRSINIDWVTKWKFLLGVSTNQRATFLVSIDEVCYWWRHDKKRSRWCL